ncbi:endonuclease/exonuclease/phosphatase family protein [Cognatishimia activa]|uniref:endonuclease/exonuclease/phosphatase family protein n=1 Tax=Cognatishimia activa TaxID=1715691 RepID=UPI002232C646|nr:endonuclease/exonuclease/phosphatase family protein [Cognatishimia activa]UZD90094.1 endonuclease/exonuclease/phosphatase family protein [Cognatishimia activa]
MSIPRLRIATYNLQKCIGLDLRRRPDRTLQVIEAIQAHVVVLQEVDKRLPPRPAALPHGMVEDHGWRILPFGAPGGSLGWHGNAMLASPDVEVCDTGHINLPGLEPRGAIYADLQTPIGEIRIVGLHLGLLRHYRLLQIAAIVRHLRQLPYMSTVFAGDFNEWGTGRDLDATAKGVSFIQSPPSFPALSPVARLDRFALSSELSHLDTDIHSAQPARIASDHLPVWADIIRSKV